MDFYYYSFHPRIIVYLFTYRSLKKDRSNTIYRKCWQNLITELKKSIDYAHIWRHLQTRFS